MEKEIRNEILNQVFTPSAPINSSDLFKGRMPQIEKICSAINEPGQHAIVFGERGVGKTSLANMLPYSFTNLYPVKITCNRKDTYKSLWKQVLGNVQFATTHKGMGFAPEIIEKLVTMSDALNIDSDNFDSDIIQLIKSLNTYKFLFIFDEFDNIVDSQIRNQFSDIIKSMSDNVTNCTIVIVGISEDVDSLIGSHQSLERCLKQIKMPRMSDQETEEIILFGLNKLSIQINNLFKFKIIEFSSGFPHYIHLLCKYACKNIISEGRSEFNNFDFQFAIAQGIENSNEQLKSGFRKATIGLSTTNKWKDVIYSCAQSELDEYNCFSITSILNAYSKKTGRTVKGSSISYNLRQLCYTERGGILEKIGEGLNTRFRFTNPIMLAYVKLLIEEETDVLAK